MLRGTRPVFKSMPEGDRKPLLRRKLLEEVGELVTAETKEAVLKEAGDVIEVVMALAKQAGLDSLEPFLEAQRKREGRGGYDRLVTMDFEKVPAAPVVRHDYGSFGGAGYSG